MACISTLPVGMTAQPSFLSGKYLLSPCCSPPHVIYSGIPPGETYDYVVPINSSGQRGTYWAHSHYGVRTFPSRFSTALTSLCNIRANTPTDFVALLCYTPQMNLINTMKNTPLLSAIGTINKPVHY